MPSAMRDMMLIVRRGSLANLVARTPRLFWWGMRGDNTRSQGELVTAHARAMPHQSSPGFLRSWRLTGAMPVPESDSGVHEKRYCCAGAETPHKRPAKLADAPRKAGG